MKYQLTIAGKNFDVDVTQADKDFAKVVVNGKPFEVVIKKSEGMGIKPMVSESKTVAKPVAPAPAPSPAAKPAPAPASGPAGGKGVLSSPIPGVIMDIRVAVGDQVMEGETMVVLEAMKMENDLVAQMSGKVTEILVQKGQQVGTGDAILVIAS